MNRREFSFYILAIFIYGALVMAACSSRDNTATQENLLEKAAQEATAIIQQAQATALVLQAQAQATALVNQANTYNPDPVPAATWKAYLPPADPTEEAEIEFQEEESQVEPSQKEEISVEVVSVGLAGEGGFIMVRFLAPAKVAERWWQGSISVEDESNGELYNEIPVMPVIGPLIGRPKQDGQLGYVMLVNKPPGLQTGVLVTVVLGEYRFEHIPVQ